MDQDLDGDLTSRLLWGGFGAGDNRDWSRPGPGYGPDLDPNLNLHLDWNLDLDLDLDPDLVLELIWDMDLDPDLDPDLVVVLVLDMDLDLNLDLEPNLNLDLDQDLDLDLDLNPDLVMELVLDLDLVLELVLVPELVLDMDMDLNLDPNLNLDLDWDLDLDLDLNLDPVLELALDLDLDLDLSMSPDLNLVLELVLDLDLVLNTDWDQRLGLELDLNLDLDLDPNLDPGFGLDVSPNLDLDLDLDLDTNPNLDLVLDLALELHPVGSKRIPAPSGMDPWGILHHLCAIPSPWKQSQHSQVSLKIRDSWSQLFLRVGMSAGGFQWNSSPKTMELRRRGRWENWHWKKHPGKVLELRPQEEFPGSAGGIQQQFQPRCLGRLGLGMGQPIPAPDCLGDPGIWEYQCGFPGAVWAMTFFPSPGWMFQDPGEQIHPEGWLGKSPGVVPLDLDQPGFFRMGFWGILWTPGMFSLPRSPGRPGRPGSPSIPSVPRSPLGPGGPGTQWEGWNHILDSGMCSRSGRSRDLPRNTGTTRGERSCWRSFPWF